MLIDRLEGMIFDMDGTLLKLNKKYIHQVVYNTLKHIGYEKEVVMEEACRFWYGFHRDEDIKRMWDVNPDLFWKIFRQYDNVEGRIGNTDVHDDINVLEKLPSKLKVGIFTSAEEKIALAEKKIIDPYFNIDFLIIGGLKEIKQKPSPDGIYRFLELSELNPKKVAMVGDSPLDILAAQTADVWDIFLRRSDGDLEGCNPSTIIQDLYGLFYL